MQLPKNLSTNRGAFVYKKFKRLILPTIIFGSLYYIFFGDKSISVFHAIVKILGGTGHLWFLPMLFWIFVISAILPQIFKYRNSIMLSSLSVLALLPMPSVPLGFGRVSFMLLFFYLGVRTYRCRDKILALKSIDLFKYTCYAIVIYIVALAMSAKVSIDGSTILMKSMGLMTSNAIRILSALSGITICFILAVGIRKQTNKMNIWSYMASLSMGVYILHQFVLVSIYYHSPLSSMVSSTILPWLALLMTLIVSIFGTWILKSNSLTRKML